MLQIMCVFQMMLTVCGAVPEISKEKGEGGQINYFRNICVCTEKMHAQYTIQNLLSLRKSSVPGFLAGLCFAPKSMFNTPANTERK